MNKIKHDKVEAAHPKWLETVKTSEFRSWLGNQSSAVRALARSPSPADAIALLNLHTADPTYRALELLRQAHDALGGMSDTDLDDFEDEAEEAEAVPAQYATRKVMQAIELLKAA